MKRGILKRVPVSLMTALLLVVLLMVLGTAAEEAYGAETSVSRYTGLTYTHNSAFANAIIIDGVDVSYVQKNNVDWKKAKADGIDFAIIRVGARGYAQAGKLIEDDYYRQNIQAAKDAGLMVGAYFFSQALDPFEAYAEAAYTLELLNGIELDLPVYMDYEFTGGSAGRLTNAQLSRLRMTENAEKFCETIEAGGYKTGFYANRNFLNKTVDGHYIGTRWPVWLASYDTYTDYAGSYHMWQYSSSGYIDGYSSRVDVNFMYLDQYSSATGIMSLAESTVQIMGTPYYTYSYGTVHEPQVYVSRYGLPLTEGIDYEVFYLKNSNAGTAYVLVRGIGAYTDYQLVPFNIMPSSSIYGITVDPPADMTYTGMPQEPADLVVKDLYGNRLVKGLDYTYTVTNSTNVGTAEVNIQFIGNYSGSRSVNYQILPGAQNLTASVLSYDVPLSAGAFYLEGISSAAQAPLTYKSSNESVAYVDGNGMVIPMGPGSAVITVTAAASEPYSEASVNITVNVSKPVQTITTNAASYTKSRLSEAFFLGGVSDAGSKLTYTSMDPSVAQVNSSGRVTLMGPGTTEILITAPETETHAAGEKRVTVKVKEMDEAAYKAKYEKLKAGVEQTKVVSIKSYPETNKIKLTWKKSNSGYNVEYYQIWRSTKKSSGYSKIFTSTDAEKKYFINSKNIKPGQTYWYKVRGVRSLEGKLVYTPFAKIEVKTPAR